MTQLHETRMGQSLITHTLPELVRQVSRLADAVERLAELHVRLGDHQPSDAKENDDVPEDRDQEEPRPPLA